MPINELIPKELGFTYSDDMSLLPLRRKEIPFAPGKGPVSLAVPGFARTMLNDLWLAASAPARAYSGEFSSEELPEVAARAGGALTWGPGLAGAVRPNNALGTGFGWPAKAITKAEANPSNDVLEQFSKNGITSHNGSYNVFSLKGGGLVSPEELPFDLQNLHSKLKVKAETPESPLNKFNAVYSDANKELGKLHFGVGINTENGKFNLIDKVTGKQFEPVAGGIAEPILKTLNEAKEKYVGDVKTQFGAPGNSIGEDVKALGYKPPAKVATKLSAPPKNDVFDASAPLSPEQRQANFNDFFSGSKLVDEVGNPMIMYHASPSSAIEAFDPSIIKKKSAGSRDFVSLTSDPNFANHWKSNDEGTTHYPVFVSAKSPGDFRDPVHVEKVATWVTREELKNWKHVNDKQLDELLKSDQKVKWKYADMMADKSAQAKSGIWTFWENPKMWKALGWDGAFMLESAGKIDKNNPVNFAAPDPGQIKSVFNKGFWNPEDHRLLYSGGGGLPLNVESVDYDPFGLEEVSGDPFEEGKKK